MKIIDFIHLRPLLCRARTKCFVITLCLTCFFALPSLAQSQRYSGIFKNEKVRVVLESVQKSTGVKFVYNAALINNSTIVTITAENETVDNFLRRVLNPLGLEFIWQDGVAVIRRKNVNNSKKINISGYVTDTEKEPLAGVNVVVAGTTIGVITDSQGKYVISANQDCVMKFSFIGMESQFVPCNNREIIDVVMKEDMRVMNDAVVTGYQTINRNQLTSSITTIKMDEIKTPGVTTLDQMLEGRVPGMIFMKNSGQVGAAPKLRIRGTSTILGNREPLWVLDGIVLADPVNVDPQQINDPDFVNLLGNAISGLNPDDIEQIDVLKDASATALYGAKAGNGVIVISTKKGKSGRPTISYSGTTTYTRRPQYSDRSIYMMNSAERMDVSKELVDRKMYYNNVSQWSGYEQALQDYYRGKITYAEFKSQSDYYASINTDWLGMLCRNAISHNHTLSLSGGTANIKYYASLGYSNENGVIKSEKSNRYSTTLNVTANYDKFNVQFSLLGNYSERVYIPADLGVMNYAYNMSRTMPAYNEDGSPFYYPKANTTGMIIYNYNIMNEINNCEDSSTGNGLNMRTQIRYNVLPSLNIDGLLSYGITNNTRETYYTKNSYYVFNLRGDQTERWDQCPVGGEFSRNESTNHSYTARLQANYSKLFGTHQSHLVSASAGIEVKSNENKAFDITRRGYFNEFGGYFDAVPTKYSGYYGQWMSTKKALGINTRQLNNELSWYATAGYGWKDRYVFNIHMRGEQSNLFGSRANSEFMPIWAVSGRWNMKKDVLKNVSWIDDIALRASWGWQGNMLPGQTSRMIMQMSTLNNPVFNSGYATISKYPNPDLRWERTSSSNLSVDFALFQNKVRGSVSYFYKHTSDAFLTKTISEINGINQYVVNGGTLENQGFELALSFTPIDNANLGGSSRGFVWRVDPQIGQVLNKVLNRAINNKTHILRDEVTYNDFLSGNIELAGKPISTFYSYRYKGLSPVDGSPVFYGSENELSAEYMLKYSQMKREDVYMAVMEESGTREPYIQGGISNYFGYRNFGVSFNLTYSLGNKIRLMKICSGYSSNIIYPQQNLRKEFTKRWRKPGDEAYTDIPGLSASNAVNSPWWNVYPATQYSFGGTVYDMYDNSNLRVVSGDYLKLQSLSFRYNIAENIAKKMGVQSAYISLSGTNLFTICNKRLKGQDPTQSGSTPNINLSERPTFSLNINFTL